MLPPHKTSRPTAVNLATYDQLARVEQSSDSGKNEVEWIVSTPGTSIQRKAAILRAAPCVVSIVSPDVPPEMAISFNRPMRNQVFLGSGTVIECKGRRNGKFFSTVLTAASLFTRINRVKPAAIKVEVYLPDGKFCKGKVKACDFHFNLAAVRIQSDRPLTAATLKELDDVVSLDLAEEPQLDGSGSSHLCSNSIMFKICPGDMVTALGRIPSGRLSTAFGAFSVGYPDLDCKELYSLDLKYRQGDIGGPAINSRGEVIGIVVANQHFLPSNVVSRWWKYYEQNKKFCRPSLGLNVANLHTATCEILEPFARRFQNVSSGVIVTKVLENTAAYRSGLRSQDVIVQCDGESVRSTLEFFEKIWGKVGASVEVCVLRFSNGKRLIQTVTVDETIEDKFYRWPIPDPWPRTMITPRPDSEMSESSDAE